MSKLPVAHSASGYASSSSAKILPFPTSRSVSHYPFEGTEIWRAEFSPPVKLWMLGLTLWTALMLAWFRP